MLDYCGSNADAPVRCARLGRLTIWLSVCSLGIYAVADHYYRVKWIYHGAFAVLCTYAAIVAAMGVVLAIITVAFERRTRLIVLLGFAIALLMLFIAGVDALARPARA